MRSRGSYSRSGRRRSPPCLPPHSSSTSTSARTGRSSTRTGHRPKAEKVTNSRIGSVGPGATAAAASGDAAKSSTPKTAAEQEQAYRQRKMEADEKARKGEKLAQEQQQQAEACANARRDLAGVQSGARVARLNEAGERIFLDDSGVQGEISRLQRDVAANCK
jgi:hypothetical protein